MSEKSPEKPANRHTRRDASLRVETLISVFCKNQRCLFLFFFFSQSYPLIFTLYVIVQRAMVQLCTFEKTISCKPFFHQKNFFFCMSQLFHDTYFFPFSSFLKETCPFPAKKRLSNSQVLICWIKHKLYTMDTHSSILKTKKGETERES